MGVAVNNNTFLDSTRLSRQFAGTGSLIYTASKGGYKSVDVSFVFLATFPTWQLTALADGVLVYTVNATEVAAAITPLSAEDTLETPEPGVTYAVASTPQTAGWYGVALSLDLLQLVQNCTSQLELRVTGGNSTDYWAVQLGSIELREYYTPAECQQLTGDELAQQRAGACPASTLDCPAFDPSQGIVYVDDGNELAALWYADNVAVQTGSSSQFAGDNERYIREDPARPATVTYFFSSGGLIQVLVTIAYNIAPANAREATLTVLPYPTKFCEPRQPTVTSMDQVQGTDLGNGWKSAQIQFQLVVKGLNCVHPRFLDLVWNAPPDAVVVISNIKFLADSAALIDLPTSSSFTNAPSSNKIGVLWIYVSAAAGLIVIILLTLLGLWRIRHKRAIAKEKQIQAEQDRRDAEQQLKAKRPLDRALSVERYNGLATRDSVQDMHVRVHVSNASYGVGGYEGGAPPLGAAYRPYGASAREESAARCRDWAAGTEFGSRAPGGEDSQLETSDGHSHEELLLEHAHPSAVDVAMSPSDQELPGTSIDLSPAAQQARRYGHYASSGRPSLPKPDIFESWHGGYASGNESEEVAGPMDSRKSSFHEHTVSPTHDSRNQSPNSHSRAGVTAQIGMRIKELEASMREQTRVSKAGARPPLDVVYGKKIGVGGFGAVYEGVWSGKTVAVKVIKMPDFKQGDDRDKMAIMEYAISGLLVHPNIVATYQADIRPIFVDGNSNASGPNSAWTGIQDYLSHEEEISEALTKQIHEWEVRLVMEYCNRGNLKEAIRKGHLMVRGQPKALHVALLALDIAKAMRQIHNYKIIHGDLKPHNVLLHTDPSDERGWIGKIADFGLSVKIARGMEHVSGIQHGTEGYVAPEVLQTRRMQKASDVYSFGILMWEMWHSKLYYEEYKGAQKRWGRVPALEYRPSFERGCPEVWTSLAGSCWKSQQADRPDFSRIIKMLEMIIVSFRASVTPEGILAGDEC